MSPRRRGFTLIELLVVIAIIAVLIALLLPAVQSAREAARRAQCVNNLKQVALAMHNYHDTIGTLPPGQKNCCWGTWMVFILPYLEQNSMYNAFNFMSDCKTEAAVDPGGTLRYGGVTNVTVTRRQINSLTCPSDTPNTPISQVYSHNYVVNFGNTDYSQQPVLFSGQAPPIGSVFGGAPFADLYNTTCEISVAPRKTGGTFNLASITDGTSNTLMAAEVIQGKGADLRGFAWWGNGAVFQTYQSPNSSLPDVLWDASYCVKTQNNPPCIGPPTVDLPERTAARSRHPGGVNAALCDGSVKFVKDSINILNWRALSTSRGGEIISSDSY